MINAQDDGSRLVSAGYRIAAVVGLCSVLVIGAFILRFSDAIFSTDSQHWGQLGDYVGGLINPMVGLATVVLVLINIKIQRLELKASLEQLALSNKHTARQSFEQSLFTWLGNYHDLLASIRLHDGTVGRSALRTWYHDAFSAAATVKKCPRNDWGPLAHRSHGNDRELLANLRSSIQNGEVSPEEIHKVFWVAMRGFETIYRSNRSDLDALFRTLYRLLLWIDSAHIDIGQRRHYVSLVRAQLSWIEVVFLLFNGLTDEGKKFATLCNKYALFDNLVVDSDQILAIIKTDLAICPPSEFRTSSGGRPWPYAASAFSSDTARDTPEGDYPWDTPLFSRTKSL